ncbi:MAG: PAS domain-containing sensor histidine kinase [Thermoanaerobaculia bacterium]|nr:PAS domain-containing sensor histidine kinase [Thermoanaerobaculia bacterium]
MPSQNDTSGLHQDSGEFARLDLVNLAQGADRLSLRLLAKAVETMSLGVTITDREGRIVYVNPADARQHGYRVDELLGASATVYADGVEPTDVVLAEDEDEPGDEPWSRERLNIKKEGDIFPVRLVSDRLYDRRRRPLGTVTLCEDITERRAVERMKQEFLSTVSHELRTPLTSIIASLDLLGDERLQDPERRAQLLDVAHRNSHRLLGLINDLLDLQKLKARKMSFTMRPTLPLPVVEETLAGMASLADRSSIALSARVEEHADANWISCDKGRLLQVLTNLLSNAIKFSPRGSEVSVTLVVDAGGGSLGGDAVRISVADQGPGIPEDFQKRLFDQFSQADRSNAKPGGSGLGLSIARGMVEGMDGRLRFDTGPKGTTFHVVFDRLASEAAPPSNPGANGQTSDSPKFDQG